METSCTFKHMICKKERGSIHFVAIFKPQYNVSTEASSHKEIEDFIAKSALILNFDHPNVLGLLGICFAQDIVPLVVLPYMENGDLQSFLRSTDKPSTSEAFPEVHFIVSYYISC